MGSVHRLAPRTASLALPDQRRAMQSRTSSCCPVTTKARHLGGPRITVDAPVAQYAKAAPITATRPSATSSVAIRGRAASAKASGAMGVESSCTCGCPTTAAKSLEILDGNACGPWCARALCSVSFHPVPAMSTTSNTSSAMTVCRRASVGASWYLTMQPTVAAGRARFGDPSNRRRVVIVPRSTRIGGLPRWAASPACSRVLLTGNAFDETFIFRAEAYILLIYGFTP
jgi:hypothetical protein